MDEILFVILMVGTQLSSDLYGLGTFDPFSFSIVGQYVRYTELVMQTSKNSKQDEQRSRI